MSASDSATPRVALFATCLVDLLRPAIGFAAAELIERTGRRVEVPAEQTCCGQPALNSGDLDSARALAAQHIELFTPYAAVVMPSGSCAATVREYPALFNDPELRSRADALAARTFELTEFLEQHGVALPRSPLAGTRVSYHDACSGLRQLGVESQPRALLARAGVELSEATDRSVCCGFGGTFCVKYPELSGRLAADKLAALEATGADVVLGGDLGCLLHLGGYARRHQRPLRLYHVAEALAGRLDDEGIAPEASA